ncbi:hypothetical protein [Bradyrhizobium cytisi]|uniref:Uncharacterized protein n=1 Tax=Bradyrhizobium cytisi TaxID=515489 RepID=A0A5S4WWC5_9BRAD|nr:hypothetical protein [Bradyrhizobium cytisi]TYL85868.1 hypothetical protein FXB38_10045 [Bradyrhizobium cytisi]
MTDGARRGDPKHRSAAYDRGHDVGWINGDHKTREPAFNVGSLSSLTRQISDNLSGIELREILVHKPTVKIFRIQSLGARAE